MLMLNLIFNNCAHCITTTYSRLTGCTVHCPWRKTQNSFSNIELKTQK